MMILPLPHVVQHAFFTFLWPLKRLLSQISDSPNNALLLQIPDFIPLFGLLGIPYISNSRNVRDIPRCIQERENWVSFKHNEANFPCYMTSQSYLSLNAEMKKARTNYLKVCRVGFDIIFALIVALLTIRNKTNHTRRIHPHNAKIRIGI